MTTRMAAQQAPGLMAAILAAALLPPLGRPARAQTETPRPSWALSAQFGPQWTTNPNDLPGRQKPDGSAALQLGISYRQPLWQDAALSLGVVTAGEWFLRETAAGFNRIAPSITLSQGWQGATFSLGVTARSSMDQPLRRHDEASQDVALSLSRPVTLAPGWTLIPSLGGTRRFYQDGSKNEWRARAGLVIARKWLLAGPQSFTWRIGGTLGYLLEDNTPVLPRMRDRSWSLFTGATDEWDKDRDLGLRIAYSRTESSYAPNRYRSLTLSPQVSALFRF